MKNNTIKVLLVEDERMLAEILADTLSDHNFEIKQAYNGVMALDGWSDFQPDVIVTDIMMPQMDGYTLVKNLRKEGCSAPILYLTARSSTEDVVKGFETGGNDFLRKPFAIDELIVRIRALAGRLKPTTTEKEYKIGRYDFLADADILGPFDLSVIRLKLSGDGIHKGGFSFAICTDQADMLSFEQTKGRII